MVYAGSRALQMTSGAGNRIDKTILDTLTKCMTIVGQEVVKWVPNSRQKRGIQEIMEGHL